MAVAGGVATVLALIAILAGWRGSDLPAQLFRVELFRRDGFVLWDSQWFSGHPDARLQRAVAGAGRARPDPSRSARSSGVVSAFLFDRLVRHEFGAAARVGSLWFAISTVTNLVVGRVTFALGVTFVLGALLALQRRRNTVGGRVRVAVRAREPGRRLVPRDRGRRVRTRAQRDADRRPGSPARWRSRRCWRSPLLFPSPGAQPYEWWALGCDLAVCALCFVLAAARASARCATAAAVYAAGARRDQAGLEPARRQRQPAQPVRGRPAARVHPLGAPPRAARAARDPARVLAVVPDRRHDRVRANRPVDPPRVLPATARLPRRAPAGLRSGRDPDHVPALGGRVRRAQARARPRLGTPARLSRTTRSSTTAR